MKDAGTRDSHQEGGTENRSTIFSSTSVINSRPYAGLDCGSDHNAVGATMILLIKSAEVSEARCARKLQH